MEELYNLDISDNTIKAMMEYNPNIKEMTKDEINEKIALLEGINCTDDEIRNIISSNSRYLGRTNEEVLDLISSLENYGFKSINVLLDSNPYILNLDVFEIEDYINNKKESGMSLEEIVDELDSNPELFNEM